MSRDMELNEPYGDQPEVHIEIAPDRHSQNVRIKGLGVEELKELKALCDEGIDQLTEEEVEAEVESEE